MNLHMRTKTVNSQQLITFHGMKLICIFLWTRIICTVVSFLQLRFAPT